MTVVSQTSPNHSGIFHYNYLTEEVSITFGKGYDLNDFDALDDFLNVVREKVKYWKTQEGIAEHLEYLEPEGVAALFIAKHAVPPVPSDFQITNRSTAVIK